MTPRPVSSPSSVSVAISQAAAGPDFNPGHFAQAAGPVSPDCRERIFEPLFSTNLRRARLGLGLALARAPFDLSGGKLTLAEHEGPETTFDMLIPPA